MVKIVVIEDNLEVYDTFKSMIQLYFAELDIIAHFTCAEDAYSFIKKNNFDWLLLDIELEGNLNGFDLLGLIGNERKFKVICFTGQQDKAIEAIRHKVFDFITKPLSIKELKLVIERYKKEIKLATKTKVETFVTEVKEEKILKVNTHKKTAYINYSDIIYIRAEGAYSVIFYENGEQIKYSKNIFTLSKELNSENLVRISRSLLINKNHIKQLEKSKNNQSKIILTDNIIIPISDLLRNKAFKLLQ